MANIDSDLILCFQDILQENYVKNCTTVDDPEERNEECSISSAKLFSKRSILVKYSKVLLQGALQKLVNENTIIKVRRDCYQVNIANFEKVVLSLNEDKNLSSTGSNMTASTSKYQTATVISSIPASENSLLTPPTRMKRKATCVDLNEHRTPIKLSLENHIKLYGSTHQIKYIVRKEKKQQEV
jgi:hypothetical protein